MRRMFGLALAALAFTTTLVALEADNSLGTWKVNLAASRYTPAPLPVKSLTVVREVCPGGVKVTSTGERTDGTAIDTTYSANYDGTPAGVTGKGSPYDTVSIKEVDSNTFLYEAKNTTGKYSATGRIVISDEGKKMTLTAKGTDADGKEMTLALVYDKQ
ncbi:hypothetical protein P8935_01720 [Telmatobacter sp. DSM 110680]|uniref:Lipocalin-like domain-containing protein n=1 Tax=Telmatobacter sp. DSM 110680 TaxID=3036704 RepID=A0AAU7DK63_9BACT